MTPFRKSLVALVSLCLVAMGFLGVAGIASAAQNAPSWSTGNQWTYSTKLLNTPATIVTAVKGQTSLTIGSSTYSVWNVNVSTTVASGGGSISFFEDVYLTVDGLRQARTHSSFIATTTSTYDPPQPQYMFPLAPGVQWNGTTHVTTTTTGGTTSSNQTYSGTVTAEQTITVPAGTFTTEVVRSPASGSSYSLTYYSDQVGNAVRTESYILGSLFSSENLTAYSYSPGLFGISNTVWIIVLVVALILIVAAVVLMRRRPRMPYPMPPQQPGQYPPQPYAPPQQPPQQGPPGT